MSSFEPIEKLLDTLSDSRIQNDELSKAIAEVEQWLELSKPVLEATHNAFWAMYPLLLLIMVDDWTVINDPAVRQLTKKFLELEPEILRLSIAESKALE